ncbi:MAG: trypsin-like peptidase domain-containing protein [Isosphaeraceae bacterium]
MRIPIHFVIAATVVILPKPGPLRAEDPNDLKIRKSVVKISASVRQLDPFRPWTKGSQSDVTGSGVVIAGKRILTNAHVVNHASQILVQPEKSSEKLPAKVEVLAPGIDLALLTLDDAAFFESHPPLPFNPKPPVLQQTVFAYGYPEGGSELSITRGIVSRIEFTEYYLETEGLRIQVDAAINPGNSGGPTVADGQLIGVAFSRLQRSDNIGYIIPMEEIELFLKDVKDGHYDGKPIIDVDFQHLENDALRSQFKLDKKTTGVLVRKVYHPGSDYPLRPGDIVIRIGDHAVDNSGMVHVDSDRMIKFQYLVQRLARDGRLPATVLRENREVKLDIPVGPHPARLFLSLSEQPPSYFVFGPLVLTEATDDYIQYTSAWAGASKSSSGDGAILSWVYTQNPMFIRYGDRPVFPGERIVIIGHPLFTHKLGKGYDVSSAPAVAAVNGVRIRNLKHAVEVIRDSKSEYIEFTFHGKSNDIVVFKRKEALDATEEILSDNGIRQQFSPDLAPVWNQTKKTN